MSICDHTSVGMIVYNSSGDILLIERRKFPFGFAAPAGHLDGDDYESGAKRELKEEVGLETVNIKLLIEGKKNNKCKREDGNWHYWKVYEVEVSGELKRSEDETKQAGWYTKEKLKNLASKTKEYLSGNIPEEEWQSKPGLEPIWYEWFTELKII